MDLRKIIADENIRAEMALVKQEALHREQVVRMEQMTKIRSAFLKYLEEYPEFSVEITDQEIRATYLKATIILAEDTTAALPNLNLSVGIRMVLPVNREIKIATTYDPNQQDKIYVTADYRLTAAEQTIAKLKRFISGEFAFTFQYKTALRVKPYESFEELLKIIN